MPGPPHTSARSPGWSRRAAAIEELSTSPSAGTPMRASAPSTSAIGGYELFVTKSTRWPARRSRSIASGAPAMACCESHTTPSMSQRMVLASAFAGATSASLVTAPLACEPGSVPRFEPFRAIRYDPAGEALDEVTAPPYDVLSESDIDAYTARSEHNIVRIDVPRERDGDGRYEQAAALLDGWLADGTLVVDETPSFTLYRMSYVDEAGRARSTVGVVGALEVVDEGAGGVLPHERTTPKAKSDRLDLTRATRTNLSPVWGLSLAAGLSALLEEPAQP